MRATDRERGLLVCGACGSRGLCWILVLLASVAASGCASEENVRKYLQEHASVYPHLLDPTTAVAIDYGISGVPETYLVDKEGVVREKSPGVISSKELRSWLDKRVGRGS